MADISRQAAAKVVTGNKVMPSILHGMAPLIPPGLNSAKPKEDTGKAILFEAIEDDTTWYSYIKGSKDGKLLEEACSSFPNYWKAHHRLALFHLYHKRTRKAFDIYTRAMKICDEYHLHVCYLKFLYHMASIHEYIAALWSAIEKVGLDHRSDGLWKEIITTMVKIYNCNLLDKNQQAGLLPNLFPSDHIISSGGGTLYPSDAEQIVFRGVNSLDPKELTYIQLYSEVNIIRRLFQRWLKVPTNNLKHAWDGYSTFENIASSANVLATKLLADAKTWYESSTSVYQTLVNMYAKVYPAKPATSVKLSPEECPERNTALSQWIEIIKYEELNPLNLPTDELVERVAYTLRAALIPFVFSSHMWYMYFQFLLLNDQREKAINDLRMAITNFLKDDAKMQFILAAYLDDVGETNSAATEFKRLVGPSLKLIDEQEPCKEELQLKQLLQYDENEGMSVTPIKLIHYLNYIRRSRGMHQWREDLQVILTKRELLSWELYWYAADTEVRCFSDIETAIDLLRQAQDGMPFNMHYTLLHLKFLLNMGKVMDVRMILTELVLGTTVVGEKKTKLGPPEKLQLWHFWLHVEYFYGTRTQYSYVKSMYATDKIASEVGLDPFVEKSNKSTQSTIRQIFSDVGPAFMRAHMDSDKRTASTEMNAMVELRSRLFCAGLEFDELDAIFLLGSKDNITAAPIASSPGSEETDEILSPSNFNASSGGNAIDEPRRFTVTRPDITALNQFNPENPTSLESQLILHGDKRPALPTDARPLDSVATPPKVLFDLLRVLPASSTKDAFPRMYSHHESIEYLLYTLKHTSFEKAPLKDYAPIPINHLLHVKCAIAGASPEESTEIISGGAPECNNGLFSILRFVEDQIGTNDDDEETIKPKKVSKKPKLAI